MYTEVQVLELVVFVKLCSSGLFMQEPALVALHQSFSFFESSKKRNYRADAMAVTWEPLLTMLIVQDLSTPLHVFHSAGGDCRDYINENDSE